MLDLTPAFLIAVCCEYVVRLLDYRELMGDLIFSPGTGFEPHHSIKNFHILSSNLSLEITSRLVSSLSCIRIY